MEVAVRLFLSPKMTVIILELHNFRQFIAHLTQESHFGEF